MNSDNTNLRFSGDPYVILLDNENSDLTTGVLEQNVDPTTAKKRKWDFPTITIASFKDGLVQLKTTSESDKESFTITLLVENDKLHVRCSCNQPVEKLCRHAYTTLQRISSSYRGNSYFKQYQQNGLASIAQNHKQWFNTTKTNSGIGIEPLPALGSIFKIYEKRSFAHLPKILTLSGLDKNQALAQPETTLCYLMMFGRRKGLSYLIPAEALLNKDGNAVKGFVQYIQTMQHPLSAGHEGVFEKCFRQIELAKMMDETIFESSENHPSEVNELFEIWQQLLPMIKHQPFVFKSWRWLWRMLNQKPRKSDIEPIRISSNTPVVGFDLIEKNDYYRMQLTISINGKVISKWRLS